MKKKSIAIIGYGGFGKFLHNSWKLMKNAEVTAVADKNPSCRPGGKIKFYENWKDLIKDKRIDIVSIATPPATHGEIACAAMGKGKHVLIEKPLATTLKDAEKIIRKRDKTGVTAGINYMQRFNPLVELLGEYSRKKVFGELRRVDVENYAQDSTLPEEHWLWDRDVSGGILIEHGVHFIDIVHSLTEQKYKKVTGMSFFRNEGQEDQIMADVLYDEGLMATHYHSFACPGFFETTSIRFAYDLARIELIGWIPLMGRFIALVNNESKKSVAKLPNLNVKSCMSVNYIEDISRPSGWGFEEISETIPDKILCSGIEYDATEMISGNFDTGLPKGFVYSECVRAVLSDLIKAIENPTHKLRATLEDGLVSLDIALKATKSARK